MPPQYPDHKPRKKKKRKPPTSHVGPIGGRPSNRPHQTIDEAGSPKVYPGNSPRYNPKPSKPHKRRGKTVYGGKTGLDMV